MTCSTRPGYPGRVLFDPGVLFDLGQQRLQVFGAGQFALRLDRQGREIVVAVRGERGSVAHGDESRHLSAAFVPS